MDTYAATPVPLGQRIVLGIATEKNYPVWIGDFSTAFLHATMDEAWYLVPPEPLKRHLVIWRLKKALYGMRRAPQLFQDYLAEVFSQMCFQRLVSDPSIFYQKEADVIFDVHVDDPMWTGPPNKVEAAIRELEKWVLYKRGPTISMTEWTKYLGQLWKRIPRGFAVRQSFAYIDSMLVLLGMASCKGCRAP